MMFLNSVKKQLDIDSEEITVEEVSIVINRSKNSKASGLDEIPAEPLKHGYDVIVTNSPISLI